MQGISVPSRRLFAITIWAIGLAIFALLGWWNVVSEEREAENRLVGEATRAAGELARLLTLSQWEIDKFTANAVIEGVMEDERIYAVKISLNDHMLNGQRRNYLWEPIAWDEEIPEHSIQGMNPIKMGGEIIGAVEVWLSPRLMREENSLLAWREVWRMAIITLIWTVVLILVLWQWGDLVKIKNLIKPAAENEVLKDEEEPIILGLSQNIDDKPSNVQTKISSQIEPDNNIIYTPVDQRVGRDYQKKHPETWKIVTGLFRQTFSSAPELMSRLYSDGEYPGLCHLGRNLELAAPCIGAGALQEKSRLMQNALNNPENVGTALAVEQCVSALEEVLDALNDNSLCRVKSQ